ncbi:MAG: ABC transporter ATP-binding protein [Phototrophicales bacterium]|nr:MAG: ABC transporter ATP-binding protein [Phototrophicales bacterium]
MTITLELKHLCKSYDGVPALDGVNLTVRRGQLVALLGPSGCGKTTTLRLIAGFEWPDEGTIRINEREVAGENAHIPPEQRRVGVVFQEYALFPHESVMGNIAFGLNGSKQEKSARVDAMLQLVGLTDLADRMPHELSGGQQQRIALARALAPQPEILLLDEPFSNLDAGLRMYMRAEIRAIIKQAGITAIFVTHDQEEALSIADAVAVMMDGRVEQLAPPQALYQRPATREVAAFVGEANFIPGQADGEFVACVLGRLPLVKAMTGAVDILIRPEALRLSPIGDSDAPQATVTWREFYGHDQRIGIRLDDGTALVVRADADETVDVDDRVATHVITPVVAYHQ